MAEVGLETIRTRVHDDRSRIVDLLRDKIALASVSAKGITGDHMRRSADYVAGQLRQVGVDARVVQATNPDGTLGAFEVIGSRQVDANAPTVLLYAHHDVQPVPDPSQWSTDPFTGVEKDCLLYTSDAADE